MPTFNDSENKLMYQDSGDVIFTVIEHKSKISKGTKTAGSPVDSLKMEVFNPKTKVTSTLYEELIDHPSCGWKYDVFLKSAGIPIAKGQRFELHQDPNVVGGIDPIGLRGWCHINIDEYQGKKNNRVQMFYTDREKLPRVVIAKEADPFEQPAQTEEAFQ